VSFFSLQIWTVVIDAAVNRASPSISLVSKRVLATPVLMAPSAMATQTSPDPANVGGAASAVVTRTPEVPIGGALVISPNWLRDDMRHRAVMTPPACAVPKQMVSPDANQTFRHVSYSQKV
jgi:hypothetical protein